MSCLHAIAQKVQVMFFISAGHVVHPIFVCVCNQMLTINRLMRKKTLVSIRLVLFSCVLFSCEVCLDLTMADRSKCPPAKLANERNSKRKNGLLWSCMLSWYFLFYLALFSWFYWELSLCDSTKSRNDVFHTCQLCDLSILVLLWLGAHNKQVNLKTIFSFHQTCLSFAVKHAMT